MQNFLQKLQDHTKPLLADGAMGTMLFKYGLGSGCCPDEVNISNPSTVERIHKEYKKAGAVIFHTNTFGANRLKLASYGLEDKVRTIVSEGVKIAKEIAMNDAFVALSVGPTGKFMKPYGTLSFNDLYEVFKEQITAGVQAGADAIFMETMGDMGELKAAYLAAREFDLPVSCAVSFAEQGGRTLMGTGPDTYARIVSNWGSDIIGTNCISPESLEQIFAAIISNSSGPVYIRPNAGVPILRGNETVYEMTAGEFASLGNVFVEKGANIFGGCCGTSPEHINSLKEALDDKTVSKNIKDDRKWLTSAVESVEITDKLSGYAVNMREYVKSGTLEIAQIKDYDVIVMDIKEACCDNMEESVTDIQATVRHPLVFRTDDLQILQKAIRSYKGIAGVIATDLNQSDVLKVLGRYGGRIIEHVL